MENDLFLQFQALDSGAWLEEEEDSWEPEFPRILEYTKHVGRFNTPLREGVYSKEAIELIEELNSLSPIEHRCVFRGTSMLDFEKALIGDVFSDKGFLSTSRCEEQARDFLVDLLLIIETLDFPPSKGRDIKNFSSLSREKEVIFLPGTKFEIVDISNLDGGPKTLIELREIF